MNAATMIKDAGVDGVRLKLSAAGALIAAGEHIAVNRWLPVIREKKTEILAELQQTNEPAVEANAARPNISSFWWQFHYSDGKVNEAACCPPSTRAEALAGEPDAISMESFEPIRRQRDDPFSKENEATILTWLGQIGETDEDTILDVLNSCRIDTNARDYFVDLAEQNVAILRR